MKLRALLDRMKLDLAEIAGVLNTTLEGRNFAGPIECHAARSGLSITQASMDIFCRARRRIEAIQQKQGELPKHLQGYAKLFTVENNHASFDLIFSDASEIRFLANKRAHRLPINSVDDVMKIIDEACPEDEKRVLKVCFTAMDGYWKLKERNEYIERVEARQHAELHRKKGDRKDPWTILNDWFVDTDPEAIEGEAKKEDLDALATEAAAKARARARVAVDAAAAADAAAAGETASDT